MTAARRRWRADWRSCGGGRWARSRRSPRGTCRARRTARAADSSASSPASCARCSGLSKSASGTWWARQVPSTGRPSTNFGPVQPFGRLEDDHRPARPLRRFVGRPRRARRPGSRGCRPAPVQRGGERLVHEPRVVALDEMRLVAVAAQQLGELLAADPRQHGRIGDLEAVQVQDRQHRAVGARVEEFVGVPAGRQRAGLRLAVADDAGDDQVGIVEGRAVGVDQRVAQLAAFVDRARRLGRRRGSGSRRARRTAGTGAACRCGCARCSG